MQLVAKRGTFLTLVSGLAEPLGAFVSYILLKNYINDVTISLVLILVAGIMMSLSIDEMIPEVNKYNNKVISIIGMILGLVLVLINLYLF